MINKKKGFSGERHDLVSPELFLNVLHIFHVILSHLNGTYIALNDTYIAFNS